MHYFDYFGDTAKAFVTNIIEMNCISILLFTTIFIEHCLIKSKTISVQQSSNMLLVFTCENRCNIYVRVYVLKCV